MSFRDWLIVTGWVTCSLTVLFVAMTLSPGLIELRDRWNRGPNYRGRRRALGGLEGPEGSGGSAGDQEDQEAAEATA